MDLDETARLLTYIAGVDPRMATNDRDAQIRAQAWQHTLRDVDANEAAVFARRYYQQGYQWSIQVGDIYQGCKPNPKWEDKATHQLEVGKAVPMPEEVRAVIGRSGPDRRARSRDCPWEACKARAGNPCTSAGDAVTWMHPSRYGDEDEAVRKAKWAAAQAEQEDAA